MVRRVLVAGCRTRETRYGAPGTATGNPLRAIAGEPGAAVRRSACVARVPAVLGPFPDVAEHVVEAEAVRRVAGHRRGEVMAVGAFMLLAEAPGLDAALVGH